MNLKYLKLIIFCLFPLLLNAQLTKDRFAGYGNISGTTLVSADTFNFTISAFSGNNRPNGNSAFSRPDVSVGDKVWYGCSQYRIRSISAFNPNVVGTMFKIDGFTPNPTSSNGIAVIREYTNTQGLISYALPPTGDGNAAIINGISIDLAACIQAHYAVQDSIGNSVAIKMATEVLSTNSISFPSTAYVVGDPQIRNYGQGRVLYPVVGSNGYSYTGEYPVNTDLLVALDNGIRVINFDKSILVKSNGDRFVYDLPNNEWIPEKGFLIRTTGTIPISNIRTAVANVNDAERFNRVFNSTDGKYYKWNGSAFVVEVTDSETSILTANPTTALTKNGDIAVIQTVGGDSVRIQQITTTKIKAISGKMTALPSLYTVSGTQTIDYTEAEIEVANLKYKVEPDTKKWKLLEGQSVLKVNFPILSSTLTATSIIAKNDSAVYIVKNIGGISKYFRQTPVYSQTEPTATEGSNIVNTEAIWYYSFDVYDKSNVTPMIYKDKQWKPQNELTVENYGAKEGNITVDLALPLQKMINDAAYISQPNHKYLKGNDVVLPLGLYYLLNSVEVGYGDDFLNITIRGSQTDPSGSGYTGTTIRYQPVSGYAFNIQGARGVTMKNLTIVGQDNIPGGNIIANSDAQMRNAWQPNTWNSNAAALPFRNKRYSSYAAITVDNYSGSKVAGDSYTDVVYPVGFAQSQYNRSNSSNVLFQNLSLGDFESGIIIGNNNQGSSDDFMVIDNVSVFATYCVSVCAPNNRNVIIKNSELTGHTGIATRTHGARQGKISSVDNTHFGGYQWIDTEASFQVGLSITNSYSESCLRIGYFGSNASSGTPITFKSCAFVNNNNTASGQTMIIPQIEYSNKVPLIFDACSFNTPQNFSIFNSVGGAVLGRLKFKDCSFGYLYHNTGIALYKSTFNILASDFRTIDVEDSRIFDINNLHLTTLSNFEDGLVGESVYTTVDNLTQIPYFTKKYKHGIGSRNKTINLIDKISSETIISQATLGTGFVFTSDSLTFTPNPSTRFVTGDVLTDLTSGNIYTVTTVGVTILMRLINNMAWNTVTNKFVSYEKGIIPTLSTSLMYLPQSFVSPRKEIWGDFTKDDNTIRNVRFSDNTSAASFFPIGMKLSSINNLGRAGYNLYNENVFINSTTATDIVLSGNAKQTGRYKVENIYRTPLDNEQAFDYLNNQQVGNSTATTIEESTRILEINPDPGVASLAITLPSLPDAGREIEIRFGGRFAVGTSTVIGATTFLNGTTFGDVIPSNILSGSIIKISYSPTIASWKVKYFPYSNGFTTATGAVTFNTTIPTGTSTTVTIPITNFTAATGEGHYRYTGTFSNCIINGGFIPVNGGMQITITNTTAASQTPNLNFFGTGTKL